jgi:uroporphyrin-III C-methyltransferase
MDTLKGKVIFVGAGPGDPELITMKGMKALQNADVILYDALVSTELLQNSPRGCKHVYVGKRKGKKEFAQDEINRLLVFYAMRYKTVVRLKGGDPNVFGRGHEEMLFVRGHGISTEMIPGISSAIAAPASEGIPLTKRGVSESFWVITGTLASGEISNDIRLAARSTATIVVLMGVSHLGEIASIINEARSPDEPIAIIQRATLTDQKIAVGTASTIAGLAQDAHISSPAVIVIGSVVEERQALLNMIEQNLVTSL